MSRAVYNFEKRINAIFRYFKRDALARACKQQQQQQQQQQQTITATATAIACVVGVPVLSEQQQRKQIFQISCNKFKIPKWKASVNILAD